MELEVFYLDFSVRSHHPRKTHRFPHTARWAGADQGPLLQPCTSLQPSEQPHTIYIYISSPLSLSLTHFYPFKTTSYVSTAPSFLIFPHLYWWGKGRKIVSNTARPNKDNNKQANTTHCINVKMEMNGWVYFLPCYLIAVKRRLLFSQKPILAERKGRGAKFPHFSNPAHFK